VQIISLYSFAELRFLLLMSMYVIALLTQWLFCLHSA